MSPHVRCSIYTIIDFNEVDGRHEDSFNRKILLTKYCFLRVDKSFCLPKVRLITVLLYIVYGFSSVF